MSGDVPRGTLLYIIKKYPPDNWWAVIVDVASRQGKIMKKYEVYTQLKLIK